MGHPYDEVRLAMLKRLQKFGYRRSQNLQVNIFSADNDIVKGVRILQRESKRDYDVIFVGGTVATMAARQPLDGGRVPVVFGSPTDPVGIGVIKDFMTPPESNFTGVCYPVRYCNSDFFSLLSTNMRSKIVHTRLRSIAQWIGLHI